MDPVDNFPAITDLEYFPIPQGCISAAVIHKYKMPRFRICTSPVMGIASDKLAERAQPIYQNR